MSNIGIYIHIPFCKQKCEYCDFISFDNKKESVNAYIKTLEKEIEYRAKEVNKNTISTIYFGGGTPSYIESKYIKEVLELIRKEYSVEENAEITIEVNPRNNK